MFKSWAVSPLLFNPILRHGTLSDSHSPDWPLGKHYSLVTIKWPFRWIVWVLQGFSLYCHLSTNYGLIFFHQSWFISLLCLSLSFTLCFYINWCISEIISVVIQNFDPHHCWSKNEDLFWVKQVFPYLKDGKWRGSVNLTVPWPATCPWVGDGKKPVNCDVVPIEED